MKWVLLVVPVILVVVSAVLIHGAPQYSAQEMANGPVLVKVSGGPQSCTVWALLPARAASWMNAKHFVVCGDHAPVSLQGHE
jgi:hypothetical protein